VILMWAVTCDRHDAHASRHQTRISRDQASLPIKNVTCRFVVLILLQHSKGAALWKKVVQRPCHSVINFSVTLIYSAVKLSGMPLYSRASLRTRADNCVIRPFLTDITYANCSEQNRRFLMSKLGHGQHHLYWLRSESSWWRRHLRLASR
jgi:hypothetical protein